MEGGHAGKPSCRYRRTMPSVPRDGGITDGRTSRPTSGPRRCVYCDLFSLGPELSRSFNAPQTMSPGRRWRGSQGARVGSARQAALPARPESRQRPVIARGRKGCPKPRVFRVVLDFPASFLLCSSGPHGLCPERFSGFLCAASGPGPPSPHFPPGPDGLGSLAHLCHHSWELTTLPGRRWQKRLELGGSPKSVSSVHLIPFLVSGLWLFNRACGSLSPVCPVELIPGKSKEEKDWPVLK